MDEYPDPDEEFELMYGDDLQALREQELENPELNNGSSKSLVRRSLNFSNPRISNISNGKSIQNGQGSNIQDPNHVFSEENPLNISGVEDIPLSQPNSQKRNIDELFGDIDDIDFDDYELNKAKKSKTENENDKNLALIERILYERQRRTEYGNPVGMGKKDYSSTNNSSNIENLSYSEPKWPSITIKNDSGQKIFVRCHNEEYMEKEINDIAKSHEDFKSLLGLAFKETWKEAETILEKKLLNENNSNDCYIMDVDIEPSSENNDLWVERYKPMRYLELLSDESTNRTLLQWLKMWDKIVFNKEIKVKKPEISNKFNKRSGKFEFGFKKKTFANSQQELYNELDEQNIPKLKVALLCGPPGCGKTTLAHMIAKHAGYNVVEINASDDRSVDGFKLALENATQMKSVLDQQHRPNCLILDEIDGAPLPTIEFLIKFISGTSVTKAKKTSKTNPHILKRPVICICNDVYTPSLRPLRQVAFVVHFPPTEISRLTQRLSEVAVLEGLKIDSSVFSLLGEKTQNDIRSCLGILNFLKSKNKQLKLADIKNMNIGEKDMSKGLFEVWQEIFQIQLPKHQRMEEFHNFSIDGDMKSSPNLQKVGLNSENSNTLKSRSKKILSTVSSAGDYERLMQGVYENFLQMKKRDSMLNGINKAYDWFIMNDMINNHINQTQNYVLMPYLPYSFVFWHLQFANLNWPKIKFPNQGYEMFQRKNQLLGITSGVEKGICSQAKPFISKSVLVLDILPILPHIICPMLRPVNIQLYSEKEKREMNTVVGVMLDYGLQYVQERSQDGTYNYILDPDIHKIGVFNEKVSQIRNLSYATKQLISREVDLEKIKRTELRAGALNEKKSLPKKSVPTKVPEKNIVPNHLQRLQPKIVKTTSTVTRDFFGRIVGSVSTNIVPKSGGKVDDIVKSPIWYHYKEGFNNAVRKDVKISDLL